MTGCRLPKGWHAAVSALLVGGMLLRCGGDGGDRTGEGGAETNYGGGKELTAPCAALQGKLQWQDDAAPSRGAEIWLLDHTAGEVISRTVHTDGTYGLECGLFLEKHVLSLHLVREQRLIADFDFSESRPGVQGAFSYTGGIGYDLGTTMVPRSPRGDIAYIPQGLAASMGGGFRILPDSVVDMNTFGSAFSPVALSVASRLIVVSPVSVLQSFYLGAQNPAAYRQDISMFSRVSFAASSKTAGFIRRVNVLAGSGWLRFARQARADDSGPTADYWAARNFELDATDQGGTFGGDVFPGLVPKIGEIAQLQVFKSAGSIVSMPRVVREVVLFPPMVTAVGMGPGSAVTAIDYQAASQKNGLTRPFCENGELRFVLAPPRSGLPGALGTTYLAEGLSASIEVSLEYYAQGQGSGSQVMAKAGDFSGVYARPQSQSLGGTVTRAWDPANQRLTFSANTGLFGETKVTVPPEVLATTVSGQRVSLTRLRILWKNATTGTGGGTVVWLQKQCS